MGLRLRKSFPLGKLLRVNVSGSGISLGIGPPGLNVNIGPRGIRRTIGIPGTGVSYQDTRSWSSASRGSAPALADSGAGSSVSGGERASSCRGGLLVVLLIVAVVAVVSRNGSHDARPSAVSGGPVAVGASPTSGNPAPAPESALSTASRSAGATTLQGAKGAASARTPGTAAGPGRALTPAEVAELQRLLNRQGYGAGEEDGVAGPRTRAAIAAFRKARGMPGAGEATERVLQVARLPAAATGR